MPLLFARQAREEGLRVVATAAEGETDPALAQWVDEVVWLRVGQLGRMIDAFKERGVRECVMLGQLAPRNLFDVRPDFRAMSLLLRIKERNAHSLFGAVAEELQREGITLIEPLRWLRPWLPGPGYCAGPSVREAQRADVAFGLRIAKEVSRLEIGQSVVVKEGTTLAVEAFEGTDACVERGGGLAGKHGGAVAVKVAKDGHDLRFDIPCIGPRTVEVCSRAGINIIAVEAHRTLLLDQPDLEALAEKLRVSVLAVAP